MAVPEDGVARLTPHFPTVCRGSVHSVFHRVVNVQMHGQGTCRMLVLASPGLPALPDSICLAPHLLQTLAVGQPLVLENSHLSWASATVRLFPDAHFSGKLTRLDGDPSLNSLRSCTDSLRCGLHRLPESLRRRAEQALVEGRWQAYLGLGSGLTPSFDDACVGMAAVYTAIGRPLPHWEDLSVTTDVSARYLRLSQEGYFGQPLLDVIHALWENGAGVAAAAQALRQVGASSGCDMLYGIRLALLGRDEAIGPGASER